MSDREAYEAYKYYVALKMHFSSDYDYFKYNGKTRVNSPDKFMTRRDVIWFKRLAKQKNYREKILANLLDDINIWIRDISESERAEEIFWEWKKRQESLSYVFSNDLKKLDPDFDDNIIVRNGQHPELIRLYSGGDICIETLVIIDDLVRCFDYWDRVVKDTIIYPEVKRKVRKYGPFLEYDKQKMKGLVLDTFRDTTNAHNAQ